MTHDFRVAESEPVYRGRVFGLRADEVVMPGGRTARREVVEHYGSAVVAAVDEHERVVLIHQYRHPLGKRLWELPAGLLDVPAEEPLTTARRELVEEVGLAAAHWATLVDVAASPGMTDEVARVFLATGLTETQRPDTVDEEADLEIRRVGIDEAIAMVMAGEIINAAAVAGLLAARGVFDGKLATRPADEPFRDRPRRFVEGSANG